MEKKNNVLKIILALLIVVAVVVLVIVFIPKNSTEPAQNPDVESGELFTFELSGENMYEVHTDTKWLTMQNDGGSHTDTYYCFDLNNRLVVKVNESYKANLGGTPETTTEVVYEKTLDFVFVETLSPFFEHFLSLEDVSDENNYNAITIRKADVEKDIFNTSMIDEIKEMLNKIDNL